MRAHDAATRTGSNNMIVCIPSLGRPQTWTHRLFEASGFTVYHFLEPQEIDHYEVPNKVNIEASGQGIAYVRNYIKSWAKERNHEHICVCDDDVTQFGKAIEGKCCRQPDASVLSKPFEYFKRSGFALGGINQRQWAWNENKNYKVNSGKVEQLHLLNLKRVHWDYDERCNGKEDKDFLMQCVNHGESFLFFPKVYLSSPVIGSNNGGLNAFYSEKADSRVAYRLANKWPEYSKIIKQNGRIDCRLNYKALAKDKGMRIL